MVSQPLRWYDDERDHPLFLKALKITNWNIADDRA